MALAVPITGLYAAIQAVIVTILVFPIGRLRTSLGVSLNDGGNATLLHVLGIALVVARIVHPLGLRMDKIATPQRIAGAAITGVVTLVAAIALLVKTSGSVF